MPIEAWPVTDRTAWHAAVKPKDPFDKRPDSSSLRPATRDKLATSYARWLCWLRDHRPDRLERPAEERLTEEAILAYLTALRGETSRRTGQPLAWRTVANYAASLQTVLRVIAPAADWTWLTPIIRRVQRLAEATPDTRRPFIHTRDLFAYGLGLMAEAIADPARPDVQRAEQVRDGVMIAFLAARPLRLKNMTALEIGRHLTALPDGFTVSLTAAETKGHNPIEFALPEALIQPMTLYLTQYRPLLAAGPYGVAAGYPEHAPFVWLARSGAMFPPDSFAAMISQRTTDRFRLTLTPHDFRRCAATTIAENNPADYRIIRIILGHTTIKMAEKHYIKAKSNQAARRYHTVVADFQKAFTQPDARTADQQSSQAPSRTTMVAVPLLDPKARMSPARGRGRIVR